MTIEKKYLNRSESAAFLNLTIKEFEKIKCLGLVKQYKIFNLSRFRARDLDYIKHIRESERDD
jgi:hypothetical protein